MTIECDDLKDACPNCGHRMERHTVETGCDWGWLDGVESPECKCPLALALAHGPRSERGGRRYS